jgi:hypothetical protein
MVSFVKIRAVRAILFLFVFSAFVVQVEFQIKILM